MGPAFSDKAAVCTVVFAGQSLRADVKEVLGGAGLAAVGAGLSFATFEFS